MWVIGQEGNLINLAMCEAISIEPTPDFIDEEWQVVAHTRNGWQRIALAENLDEAKRLMQALADKLHAYMI